MMVFFSRTFRAYILIPALVALTSFMLLGCQQSPNNGPAISKQTVGGIGGAVLGGLLGSRFGKGKGKLVSVAAGTILGGLIGSSIGSSMDNQDRMRMSSATQSALERNPSGRARKWSNPDTGYAGTITPVRTFKKRKSKRYCREFEQTITIGGKTQKGYGTACRQPDGAWKIAR